MILMNDFESKRKGGQRRKASELEDRIKNNWKRNLLVDFDETKEGTKRIDKIRDKYMIGNKVFLNMNLELWKHAPLKYTLTLSSNMLRELALTRQMDKITAYDSAKSISEDEIPNHFSKKDGREPCITCSSGSTQFNQNADKEGVYHRGLHSSSQQMKFCRMNAEINYRGEYYCMMQKRYHHYVTGPIMILIVSDQILGDIGNLILGNDIHTPICFEFL